MTTFQAIINALIYAFTSIFPISETGHLHILSETLHWPYPGPALMGAMEAGLALALFLYYRHDWASVISSALRVLLLWQRPRSIDERMPLFLLLATAPAIALSWQLRDSLAAVEHDTTWVFLGMIAIVPLLWLADRLNRRTKNLFSWNWLDALTLGICQIAALIPGSGRQAAALSGSFLRNYNREAAVKFVMLSFVPWLAINSYWHLSGPSLLGIGSEEELSWLSFWCAFLVSLVTGLLAIGGLLKDIEHKSLRTYLNYRIFAALAGSTAVWYFGG